MTHLDLFSGIGGFALAAQTVWGSDYHCVGFCEIDSFCQQVLRKNFEGVKVYGDIRGLTAERLAADAEGSNAERFGVGDSRRERQVSPSDGFGLRTEPSGRCTVDLLTGGFPCQPFSTAGKRKGTQDDRFLWPEMLRVIREVKPHFIIGENVAGIVEMALGQVCADLEGLGYEVQCFIIPACAVNAPHRRDRVWIVAHAANSARGRRGQGGERRSVERIRERGQDNSMQTSEPSCRPSSDSLYEGLQGRECESGIDQERRQEPDGYALQCGDMGNRTFPGWSRDWREVAALTCVHRMDDGLPRRVVRLPDGGTISESKWRQEALKCYGNSIVPQVAMELMKAIKEVEAVEAVGVLAEAA